MALCVALSLATSLAYADINPAHVMQEIQANSSQIKETKEIKQTTADGVTVSYSSFGDNQALQNIQNKSKPRITKKVDDNFYSKANPNTLIGKLARKGYALVLFFDSSCPHCQRFAPVVKGISKEYGISVYPFSFGGSLPSFPNPSPVNKSIYQTYYGSSKPFYPVMFLQNVNTMQFYLVSKGEASEAQITTILNHYAKGLLNV